MAKRKARRVLWRMETERRDANDGGNGGGGAIFMVKPLVLGDDGVWKERVCWRTCERDTIERQNNVSR